MYEFILPVVLLFAFYLLKFWIRKRRLRRQIEREVEKQLKERMQK